jgi:tetratricopeptide (TPR) repeat protein
MRPLTPSLTGPTRGILAVAVIVACATGGCDSTKAEARRQYFKALELSHTGAPLEDQLGYANRAVQLEPASAIYLELRAGLLFSVNRLSEARADFDRTVELADRPYLRYERANLLCALGEYAAALTDLDRAIGAQPSNTQFYPRRALARLAVGRVIDARADIEHASAIPNGLAGSHARAAVLLMEGKPAEALVDLDPLVESSDYSHQGLFRAMRMLAHAALKHRDRVLTEFDRERLAAAAHYPDLGFRYWFVSRSCDNAFIVTQAGGLRSKVETMVSVSDSAPPPPVARVTPSPASPPPAFRPRPLLIVESSDTSVLIDLDRQGIDPNANSLATLQLLDDRGVRIAQRVAVRKECANVCGEDGSEECHIVGAYRYAGPPLAPYAIAFEARVDVRPHSLDRTPMPRAAQLGRLAQIFAGPGRLPVESEAVYSWTRADASGDWAEQSSWFEEVRSGRRQLSAAKTGILFADCSLTVFGPLTEFDCPDRRSTYLGSRHLGGTDELNVRYSADVDGTLAYFVIVDWNSVIHVRIVFRLNDEWYEDGVDDDRTVC